MHKPKALKFCTLLDKPERRKVDLTAEYVGFKFQTNLSLATASTAQKNIVTYHLSLQL